MSLHGAGADDVRVGLRVRRFAARRSEAARHFVQVSRLLRHAPRLLVAALVAARMGAVATVLGRAVVLGVVVARVQAAFDAGFGRGAVAGMTTPLLLYAGLLVTEAFLVNSLGVLEFGVSRHVDGHVRYRVRDAAMRPSTVEHLENPGFLDQVAQTQYAGMAGTLGNAAVLCVSVVASLALVVGAAVVVAQFSPLYAAALLGLVLVGRSLVRTRRTVLVDAMVDAAGRGRRASYLSALGAEAAAKETRVFGLAGFLTNRYTAAFCDARKDVWRVQHRLSFAFLLIAGGVAVGYIGVYVLMVREALAGAITLGALTTYMQASQRMLGGLWALDANGVEHAAASLRALGEIEGAVEARPAPAMVATATATACRPPDPPSPGIRFEKLAFEYPQSGVELFRDLDLEITAGTSVGIVGVNGVGKTTLTKLLARLYEPSGGRITIDGVDLRDIDVDVWRRRLAVIFQDFVRYEFSARDNIGFGAVDLLHDEVRLERAALRAGIADVVSVLDRGWDTVLSRAYTGGTDLSGGQWQRIALARALMAVEAGADILVLDEPTASLDVRAEAELFDRFLDLTAGLTTILISHRFPTVRRAERIIVLDDGRVSEDGDHASLLADGGQYARLFKLQATRFATESEDLSLQAASGRTVDG